MAGDAGMRDRRLRERKRPEVPMLGILKPCLPAEAQAEGQAGPDGSRDNLFVQIVDISSGGAQVEAPQCLASRPRCDVVIYDPELGEWKTYRSNVVWTNVGLDDGQCLAGLEFDLGREAGTSAPDAVGPSLRPEPEDVVFLLGTELLENIPRSAVSHLLNCLLLEEYGPGERFIRQGDPGDCLYIIQDGTCSVKIEKEGALHHIAVLRPGDVVGEMAVLTGAPRAANVEADGPLRLWRLNREEFFKVAGRNPDLLYFLTELISNRFETSPLVADRTVGKYVLKHKLGKGGWSLVYQGFHKTLHLPVAVKMLRHVMAMEPRFQDKFKQEGSLIAMLNHPNIVQVYDIEEMYRTIFIIMEYLEGESLEGMLKRVGRLPCDRAAAYLAQVCSGLAFAHSRGIVHQDIKPANIFISARDRVKILDFGLACASGQEVMDMPGTIQYAAPEQIYGQPVDGRTDVYCLGIMAYEMVTGRRPYPEDDLGRMIELRLAEDVPEPRAFAPDIPEPLRRFILKACERAPDRRYQSMDQALADLEPLVREAELHESSGLDKQHLITLFLVHKEHHRPALQALLEEFGQKAQALGVGVKAVDALN